VSPAAWAARLSALLRRGGTLGLVLLGGLFAFLIGVTAHRLGPGIPGLVFLPPLALVAAAALVDARQRRVPDALTLPALAWVLLTSPFLGRSRVLEAIVGLALCGGLLLLLGLVSRGSLGGGDVKLAAVIGASLGWKWGLAALCLAQLAAAAVAAPLVLTRRRTRKDTLPMGPFIAIAALLAHLARPL